MAPSTEMSLFVRLDVEDPLNIKVKEVNVGSNLAYSTKPGVAILVTVDAGSLGESLVALAGLIRNSDKYAWVLGVPDIDWWVRKTLKQKGVGDD